MCNQYLRCIEFLIDIETKIKIKIDYHIQVTYQKAGEANTLDYIIFKYVLIFMLCNLEIIKTINGKKNQ